MLPISVELLNVPLVSSFCIKPCWTNCLFLPEPTSRPYKKNWVSWTWMNNRGNDWKPFLPRKPRLGSWRMKILTPYVSWVLEMEEWSTRSATNPLVWSWLGRWRWLVEFCVYVGGSRFKTHWVILGIWSHFRFYAMALVFCLVHPILYGAIPTCYMGKASPNMLQPKQKNNFIYKLEYNFSWN